MYILSRSYCVLLGASLAFETVFRLCSLQIGNCERDVDDYASSHICIRCKFSTRFIFLFISMTTLQILIQEGLADSVTPLLQHLNHDVVLRKKGRLAELFNIY